MNSLAVVNVTALPQLPSGAGCADLRPHVVRRWLANLPLANLGATSGALYEALKEANRLALSPRQRLSFLDALRPTLASVIAGLRSHYKPHQFPCSPKSRRTRQLALALLREMAFGYDLITQTLGIGSGRINKRHLTVALQRSVRCHSALLFECYYLYQPAPAGVWKALHELYLTAEALGVEDVAVKDEELCHRGRGTVADSYKQALLLAAAGPHRIRHQELEEIFAALDEWAPAVSLRHAQEASPSSGRFRVNLRSDQPPQPLRGACDFQQARLLDCETGLSALAGGCNQRHTWRRLRRHAPVISETMSRRLMQLFGISHQRHFSRMPMDQPVHAVVGLTQVSHMLARQQGVELGAPSGSPAPAVSVVTHAEDARWVYDEDHRDWMIVHGRERSEAVGHLAEQEKPASLGRQQWQVMDTSANGYRLLLDASQATPARIGEMIAVREADASPRAGWQIGVIRWMRDIPLQGLQLGVQLIGIDAMAVSIKPKASGDHECQPVAALVLPDSARQGHSMRMLTPPMPFMTGVHVTVVEPANEYDIRLTREVDRTGSFKSFQFEAVVTVEDEPAQAEEEFAALYGTL